MWLADPGPSNHDRYAIGNLRRRVWRRKARWLLLIRGREGEGVKRGTKEWMWRICQWSKRNMWNGSLYGLIDIKRGKEDLWVVEGIGSSEGRGIGEYDGVGRFELAFEGW